MIRTLERMEVRRCLWMSTSTFSSFGEALGRRMTVVVLTCDKVLRVNHSLSMRHTDFTTERCCSMYLAVGLFFITNLFSLYRLSEFLA